MFCCHQVQRPPSFFFASLAETGREPGPVLKAATSKTFGGFDIKDQRPLFHHWPFPMKILQKALSNKIGLACIHNCCVIKPVGGAKVVKRGAVTREVNIAGGSSRRSQEASLDAQPQDMRFF